MAREPQPACHELCEPLRAVRGDVSTIGVGGGEAEFSDAAAKAATCAKHLARNVSERLIERGSRRVRHVAAVDKGVVEPAFGVNSCEFACRRKSCLDPA